MPTIARSRISPRRPLTSLPSWVLPSFHRGTEAFVWNCRRPKAERRDLHYSTVRYVARKPQLDAPYATMSPTDALERSEARFDLEKFDPGKEAAATRWKLVDQYMHKHRFRKENAEVLAEVWKNCAVKRARPGRPTPQELKQKEGLQKKAEKLLHAEMTVTMTVSSSRITSSIDGASFRTTAQEGGWPK